MKIQVVLGQVGEDPGGEADTPDPVKHQGVGGDLHHHMGTARVGHLPQQRLELVGLGGGPVGGEDFLSDHVLVGADETYLGLQGPLQRRLQQIGGGGLAVGAGHPYAGHGLRRAAEPVGRHVGQGGPGVPGHQPRAVEVGGTLAQNGGSPLLQGLPDVAVSVGLIAGQRREKGSRLEVPGVIADPGDFHVPGRPALCERHAGQQLLQIQSAFTSWGKSPYTGVVGIVLDIGVDELDVHHGARVHHGPRCDGLPHRHGGG